MRTVFFGITVLALLWGAGPTASARKKGKHAFDAAYGPARSGLRLAAQVDRAAKQVRFLVKNTGARVVNINVRYSCSGYSHWGLRGGGKPGKLSRSYIWSHAKSGLELSTRTRPQICTVNGPIRAVRLAPGMVTTVTIPVAKGVKLRAKRYLQGHVSLFLTVHKHVTLRTAVTRRL